MTNICHSRHSAPGRCRTLALCVMLLSFAIGLPDALRAQPNPPAADYDVLPAEWMGLADDLLFPRVEVPTAALPRGYAGRPLTSPALLNVELAALPSLFGGRDPAHPIPAIVAFAAVPAELVTIGRQEGVGLTGAPTALQFVMSAATDQQGNQWFGCEDSGVFCYTPATSKWKQFTTKDGLGDDNAYALAIDKLGRVWVGHLNHGVSVYNGHSWQNYEVVAGLSKPDTLAGPLGERIFDIAVSPTGDVWMATSAGLARYSDGSPAPAASEIANRKSQIENRSWRYYTRAEGLPSDQAQSLAFAPDGTLYVGTQCDGIAIASPKDNYTTWRTVTGPDRMPAAPFGNGLPTNLINDLLVAKDGTVYAATTLGLAESKDAGQSWQYWRGEDYAAKVKGLYGGPPQDWQEQPGAWLAEDYVTCLAEDARGLLIGYRTRGYELVNPATGARLAAGSNPDDFVTAMLSQSDGSTVTGTYREGVRASAAYQSPNSNSEIRNPLSAIPPFPATAQPPSPGELAALTQRLQSIPAARASDEPLVVALADDWSTRGDWLGRYGKYWVCTTAMDYNYMWGAGAQPVGYHGQIGPHAEKGDSLRYWIHWLATTDPRSMEMPPVYMHSRVLRGETTWDKYRRQAEHDDHSEEYAPAHEGPNLYYSLNIPPGLYILSFYNTNKDGHTANNRFRDYRFSVRPFVGQGDKLILTDPREAETGRFSRSQYVSLDGFAERPELASARQHDFWGGTYKRFLVRGPSALTIEIARNGSYSTINAGIFLDEALNETPDPYFPIANPATTTSDSDIATVLAELSSLAERNPKVWASYQPIYSKLLRKSVSEADARRTPEAATCYFQSHQFVQWEAVQKDQGLTTAREIEKALRWDQKTFACTGKGRQFVQAYVAANPPKAASESTGVSVIDFKE